MKDLSLKLLIAAGNSIDEQTAVLLKDQLGKVGINVEIEKQEQGQEWDSTVAGDYDLSLNYWTNDIIDPDEKTTFSVYGNKDNRSYYTHYKNPKVTELVEQGRIEMDAAKRKAIYDSSAEDRGGRRALDRPLLQPLPQRLAQEGEGLLPEPDGPLHARGYVGGVSVSKASERTIPLRRHSRESGKSSRASRTPWGPRSPLSRG